MDKKITIAFLFSLIVSIPVAAATAIGYVPFTCPMSGGSELHLTKLDNKILRRELVLIVPQQHLWGAVDPKEWYDSPSKDCSSGECEPTRFSKVQFLHISYRSRFPFVRRGTRISGNFEIDLRDGRKLSGSFKARLRNPPKHGRCE